MFECDVKLSADGVVFLMHDATLQRTTSNGQGVGGDLPWHALSQLDAGSWHSRTYAGEALPTLEGHRAASALRMVTYSTSKSNPHRAPRPPPEKLWHDWRNACGQALMCHHF
jgi:glycerophosphoryl diester phosphodiesterase